MGFECGDYVLDTDGAHWVPAINCAPTGELVDASAVADAGEGSPRGPRGSETDTEAAYDQSPYPETREGYEPPRGYMALSDFPYVVPVPREVR